MLSFVKNWLWGAVKKSPWLLVVFLIRLPEKLLEDRIVGGLNHLIDARGGGAMSFFAKAALFSLYHPSILVAITIIGILVYSAIREEHRLNLWVGQGKSISRKKLSWLH